jgi:hypothetical protein
VPPDTIEVSNQHTLPLDREQVWYALNDPDILQQCIKGCDQVIRHDPTRFSAVFRIRLGPVYKNFQAHLEVEDADVPTRYRLVSAMRSRLAGDIKGSADVVLHQQGDHTRLDYNARIEVDGWFPSLGVNLLGSSVERAMGQFFDRFVQALESPPD